jgi:hypothetical protein
MHYLQQGGLWAYQRATTKQWPRMNRWIQGTGSAGFFATYLSHEDFEAKDRKELEEIRRMLAVPDLSTEETYNLLIQASIYRITVAEEEVEALLPELVFRVDDIEAYEKRHPLPTCVNAPPESLKHSPDFRSVWKNGKGHSLTSKQAQVIAELWESQQNGTPEVSQEYLLEMIYKDTYVQTARLRDIFRTRPDAWKSLIEPGKSKGTVRLKE